MIMELDSQVLNSENRFYAQYMLPHAVGKITNGQFAVSSGRRFYERGLPMANPLEHYTP